MGCSTHKLYAESELSSPCPYSGPTYILSLLDQHTASSLFLLPLKPLQSAPHTQPEGACEPLSHISGPSRLTALLWLHVIPGKSQILTMTHNL